METQTESTIKLEIITPHGVVFNKGVSEIIAVGVEGEVGLLPGHASFITALQIGILAYRSDKETRYIFVNSGYLEISGDRAIILADSAEQSEDIDVERAGESQRRAEEMLKQGEKIDFARADASIKRATMRIQAAEKMAPR